LDLWKELHKTGAWTTVVVEDRRRPLQDRIVGFGISVFVTDEFTRRALAGSPFLSRDFLRLWVEDRKPYLSKKEVAIANAEEGLNLLVLHYGWKVGKLSEEELQQVRLRQAECFIESHAGYKIKEYIQEVFDEATKDFVLTAGSVLRHDYKGKKWSSLLRGVTQENWPYLTGFRPAEALARAGTPASMLQAKTVQPRFRFSPGEQEMLTFALGGKTDEELAESLNLSPWTIKKRWQAVYEKIKKADPELLADLPKRKKAEIRVRQGRRYLIDYLRYHPEELRPRATPGR
jgi:DNA-binding CsgD family transcriptional regulator